MNEPFKKLLERGERGELRDVLLATRIRQRWIEATRREKLLEEKENRVSLYNHVGKGERGRAWKGFGKLKHRKTKWH